MLLFILFYCYVYFNYLQKLFILIAKVVVIQELCRISPNSLKYMRLCGNYLSPSGTFYIQIPNEKNGCEMYEDDHLVSYIMSNHWGESNIMLYTFYCVVQNRKVTKTNIKLEKKHFCPLENDWLNYTTSRQYFMQLFKK